MKKLLTAMLLLVATSTWAQNPKTIQVIKALSQKRIDWLLKSQTDSIAKLYDAKAITIHDNGFIRTTAEHLAELKAGRPVYTNIRVQETNVRDFGDVAILLGKGVFDIKMGDQNMKYNMVYTETYQKHGTIWKLIARQANQIK